jgi:predicted transcriptional regulator
MQMSITLTVRLPDDLAARVAEKARKSGVSKSQLIREQLQRALAAEDRPFLRLAGAVSGRADLSSRKGFSRK